MHIIMGPLEWEPGTILFHREKSVWREFLKSIKVNEKDLPIDETKFNAFHKKHNSITLQEIFKQLFLKKELWTFYYRPIKKRDGSISCKVVAESREGGYTLHEVPAEDVYFAMKMLDWDFRSWCLLEDKMNFVKTTRNKACVRKYPSKKTRNKCEKLGHLFPTKPPGKRMLYSLVSCPEKYVLHPLGHIINSENQKYDSGYIESGVQIFAIPYEYNNLQPTSFKSAWEDERMSIIFNFRDGFPFDVKR